MFLQQPTESPYDVRFHMLGFPTRISWTFWLVSVVLGYNFAQFVDRIYARGGNSPGTFALLVLWVACMAASILIHELGHAVAFRRYGLESLIVLYFMGGLAIPTSSFRGGQSTRSAFRTMGSREELIVAAAGPAFQIGSALLIVFIAWMLGYRTDALSMLPGPLAELGDFVGGDRFGNAITFALVNFYVWPSICWGVLNLLPVLPLDGGRIAKAIIEMQGGQASTALWISVITAGLIALYGFTAQQTFLGFFFASLAINNYQAIQQGSRW